MRWSEIIVEGPKAAAVGFVAGYLAARDRSAEEVVWQDEVGLSVESLPARIASVFSAERHQAFYAPELLAAEIASAIEKHGVAAELRVERQVVVGAVAFEFEAEVFSEELALELRGMIKDLPDGTTIDDLKTGQELHPEARGVELYSPQHDFTFRMTGRVRGNGAALRLLRRLHEHDFVKIHNASVEAAAP